MRRKELIRKLIQAGWKFQKRRGKGSHELYKHPKGSRSITVPSHGSDIPEILAAKIRQQMTEYIKED